MRTAGTDGITLVQQQAGQAGGGPTGVVEFAVGGEAELHRAAGIERHNRVEIRFLFELPDEVAVVAGVDLPVNLTNFVARSVLAMLGELATASLGGRPMFAGQKPVDDGP